MATPPTSAPIITYRRQPIRYFTEDLGSGIGLDMVLIPAGNFTMGSPATEEGRYKTEGPQHSVTVKSFCMGRYPITQAQYEAITGKNPSAFKENGANRPVESVSWHDAVAFCEQLSAKTGRTYRLPSEAEWEYACRAGTSTPYHFGTQLTPELANYSRNIGKTSDVGSFEVANGFGLFDMHGNAYEWCADYWHDNYRGAPTDGSAWIKDGDGSVRVLRGGSWSSYPRYCRSANRSWLNPVNSYSNFGFLVICSAPGT
jgi:formylglycine-generating enzyme required for sulfatase activity